MDSSRNIVRKLRENRLLNERKNYESMETKELIQLAKDGDQFAFNVLLDNHRDFLWRMTRKYVPEGTFDSDDIMQHAEIAFWEAVNKWDMSGDFEAFAGMVIKRRMADELRKLDTDKAIANRNTKSINGAEDGSDDEDGAGEMNKSEFDSWMSNSHRSAEDEFMDRDSRDRLVKFFSEEMTDIERKLIRMYLDGYKMSEIAEVTGLKYKACENAVRRAKNKIKDYFNNMRESRQIKEVKDSIFSEEESRFLKDILDQIDESKKINESTDDVNYEDRAYEIKQIIEELVNKIKETKSSDEYEEAQNRLDELEDELWDMSDVVEDAKISDLIEKLKDQIKSAKSTNPENLKYDPYAEVGMSRSDFF